MKKLPVKKLPRRRRRMNEARGTKRKLPWVRRMKGELPGEERDEGRRGGQNRRAACGAADPRQPVTRRR